MALEFAGKNEGPRNVPESGLIHPFINKSLKEGVTEQEALAAQGEWKKAGDEWEALHMAYWNAYTAYTQTPFEQRHELLSAMEDAKKLADDNYNEKYLPAYHQFHDVWNIDAPKQ